jgi:hypothetical protein
MQSGRYGHNGSMCGRWLLQKVVQVDATQAVVEVEPLVLSAGADDEVGERPTIAADADTTDRWGEEDGTPSGT